MRKRSLLLGLGMLALAAALLVHADNTIGTWSSAAAGQVPNSSSTTISAWTYTPTLGIAGSAAGYLITSNGAGGGATTVWSSSATTTNTVAGPTVVPTTGHLLDCSVSSTTCTLHDTGIATANVTQTIASGTSAMGTGAIASGACATVVTTTATGTATTDVIQAGFNADPTSTTGYQASANGMLTIIDYPTSGNVNFKVCNNTASSITPGAVTLNWRVAR